MLYLRAMGAGSVRFNELNCMSGNVRWMMIENDTVDSMLFSE